MKDINILYSIVDLDDIIFELRIIYKHFDIFMKNYK